MLIIKFLVYKDYFRITFCLDLICNKDIKDYRFVCVGVEFLAFNVLLHTLSKKDTGY